MADETSGVEITEDEKVEGEIEAELEGPVVPTHDPFAYKVLTLAQSQQALNGLRHNDHLRYRQYCTRRLRRLYNVLRYKHGRGRYKANPFPADFNDMRFLEIPMVQAERAWSYGVQLKADNAAASAPNAQWRHHAIARFAKAVKWAQKLEELCKVHGDQRSQLEAEAYTSYLQGMHSLEKEAWSDALSSLKLCKRVCDRLGLASDDADKALFKSKVQELEPMLRLCKYNLGQAHDDDDDQGGHLAKVAAGAKRELSELSYRGQALSIPSDKIKVKLLACLQLVSAIQVGKENKANEVIEKYGDLAAEFGDTLKDIHTDMINAGSDEAQVAEWHMLEAYARELAISMNVERNLVLLWNHMQKLDGLEEISSPDSRKLCRPEEGVRFCDLLKEDVENLKELPETSDAISASLTAYHLIVVNCRCFFLALCYGSVGKTLEAASLIDMLHMRMPDMGGGKKLDGPLGRIHARFEEVFTGLPTRVAQWRCRGLAHLCKTQVRKTDKDDEQAPPVNKPPLEQFASLDAFPPRFRDIPCKPLLFDLAFMLIVQPDLEGIIGKKTQDEEKRGLLRSVTSGLGSRLSGLWGRK